MRPSSVRQGDVRRPGSRGAGSRPPRARTRWSAARRPQRRRPSGCRLRGMRPRRLADRVAVQRHERAAVILVAASHHDGPCRAPGAARSFGQSTKGGSEAPDGRPMRSAATLFSPRRCDHGVGEMGGADHHRVEAGRGLAMRLRGPAPARVRCRSARPAVVGVLTPATTASSSIRAASVLVPPTSMPIRFIGPCPRRPSPEVEIVAEGARADVLEPFGVRRIGGAGSAMTVTRWP